MRRHPVKIPPMLTATITMGLSALDGVLFKDLARCPHCGGKPMPYDTKVKQYVTLISGEEKRTITVKIRRFICHDCGKLLYANEPFYPDTRTGSTIVDLALCLSRTTSFTHAAVMMDALGIELTRATVRNFALSRFPMVPVSTLYGIPMPSSFISLIGRGISAAGVNPIEVLKMSGYPSQYRPGAEGVVTARAYFRKKKAMKTYPKTF